MEFGHLEGEQPYIGVLLTNVNYEYHLLNGMILQADIQTPAEKVFGSPNFP